MLNKLAFRNVLRSAKDYMVYFLTMTLVTAIMFAFHSLIFSQDLQQICETAGILAVLIGLASFFVVLIVAWLINYMVRFILEKRSREFGIYMLIGMKKKEISRLYMRESLVLGAGAFLGGLGLGILLQQVLLAILYSMVMMEYHMHLEWNRECLLTTAACFGGCYLLALLRCRRRFRKMNIYALMNSRRKNEEIRESHERAKRLLLPLSLLFLAAFALMLFFYKAWDSFTILGFLIGLVLTIYLFYTGVAAWIICYIRKKGNGIFRGQNLFLLRQFTSKVKTLRFTLGSLTSLFVLALLRLPEPNPAAEMALRRSGFQQGSRLRLPEGTGNTVPGIGCKRFPYLPGLPERHGHGQCLALYAFKDLRRPVPQSGRLPEPQRAGKV